MMVVHVYGWMHVWQGNGQITKTELQVGMKILLPNLFETEIHNSYQPALDDSSAVQDEGEVL